MRFQEPGSNAKTNGLEQCDVFVAGGGIAGVAAALAAAREGKHVILAEKQCVLGGLATSGLVTIYLPLCDGMGQQVSYGIAEELLRLSIVHGAQGPVPQVWLQHGDFEQRKRTRYAVQFNPVLFALELERLLLREQVTILYDTRVCDITLQENRAYSVLLENLDGRTELAFSAAVDATGDALLFQKAGVETRRNLAGNSAAGWYYSVTSDGLRLNKLGFIDAVDEAEPGTSVEEHTDKFIGDCARDINAFLLQSHWITLCDVLKERAKDPSFEPVLMAHMPQLRMTRCMHGVVSMTSELEGKEIEDSIGMIADWRRRGPKYEIPYDILRSPQIDNLFAAGRCVSTQSEMWDVLRVIPACAVTGQAAGIAAALVPDRGDSRRTDSADLLSPTRSAPILY